MLLADEFKSNEQLRDWLYDLVDAEVQKAEARSHASSLATIEALKSTLKEAYGLLLTINNGMEPRHRDMLAVIEDAKALLSDQPAKEDSQ
jgi:hypothetical protein